MDSDSESDYVSVELAGEDDVPNQLKIILKIERMWKIKELVKIIDDYITQYMIPTFETFTIADMICYEKRNLIFERVRIEFLYNYLQGTEFKKFIIHLIDVTNGYKDKNKILDFVNTKKFINKHDANFKIKSKEDINMFFRMGKNENILYKELIGQDN